MGDASGLGDWPGGNDKPHPEDNHGPRNVDRWHRRHLAGEPTAPKKSVHRLVVEQGRVDKAKLGKQARRGDRDELGQQAKQSGQGEGIAKESVVNPMGEEDPDQYRHQRRHMHDEVVHVRCLNNRRVGQDDRLQDFLRREVQGLLDINDPAAPIERRTDTHTGDTARVLPEAVERHDD